MFTRLENPSINPNTRWGNPLRMLHTFFYKLDLNRYNILVEDPLDVRNFVTQYGTYTPDKEQYGVNEHFPANVEECYNIIRTRKDDCDGLSILTASILYTLENDNVRLTAGHYGQTNGLPNHMFVLLIDPGNDNDPFVLETTGNKILNILPSLSECPYHFPHIICNPQGDYWICED
jgi:hypothetical protein